MLSHANQKDDQKSLAEFIVYVTYFESTEQVYPRVFTFQIVLQELERLKKLHNMTLRCFETLESVELIESSEFIPQSFASYFDYYVYSMLH